MTDIGNKNVSDLFVEANENVELLNIYKEIEENKSIISPIKNLHMFRTELLSEYLNSKSTDYKVTSGDDLEPEKPKDPENKPSKPEEQEKEPEVVEPPKIDVPEVNIPTIEDNEVIHGSVPENKTFEEYRDSILDVYTGKNPDVDSQKIIYQLGIITSIKDIPYLYKKDIVSDIKATNNIDELNELFDNIKEALDDFNVGATLTALENDKDIVPQRFAQKTGDKYEFPTPNGFRFIDVIKSKSYKTIDTRTDPFLDLPSLYNDSKRLNNTKIPYDTERIAYAKVCGYYDIEQLSEYYLNLISGLELYQYSFLREDEDFLSYIKKAEMSQNISVDNMIRNINEQIPDHEKYIDRKRELLAVYDKPMTYDEGIKAMSVVGTKMNELIMEMYENGDLEID